MREREEDGCQCHCISSHALGARRAHKAAAVLCTNVCAHRHGSGGAISCCDRTWIGHFIRMASVMAWQFETPLLHLPASGGSSRSRLFKPPAALHRMPLQKATRPHCTRRAWILLQGASAPTAATPATPAPLPLRPHALQRAAPAGLAWRRRMAWTCPSLPLTPSLHSCAPLVHINGSSSLLEVPLQQRAAPRWTRQRNTSRSLPRIACGEPREGRRALERQDGRPCRPCGSRGRL